MAVVDLSADLGLLEVEKLLREEVRNLEEKKEEQLKEVRQLRKEDEELCAKLELDPYYVSLKVIPAPDQVVALRKHVSDMRVSYKHADFPVSN